MLRRFSITILSLLLFFPAHAEKENYIILFDCTASMKGSDGGPDIWKDAKNILVESIMSLNGDNANVVVVPFQDQIGQITEFVASDKSKINKILSDVDKMISTRHRGTSICRAWDVGLKYLEEGCLNFMFLLTDGADNIQLATGLPVALKRDGSPKTEADAALLDECTEEVCKRIRQWCSFGANNIAFYSRLTQNAQVDKITEAAKGCKNITFADGLNVAQLKTREVTFNVADLGPSNNAVKIPLKLSNSLSGRAEIVCGNPLFDLSLGSKGFINGEATLLVTSKVDYGTLRSSVGRSASFKAEIRVDDSEKENLNIYLPEFTVNVIGNPEKTVAVEISNDKLGKALYHYDFLWSDASAPDTLYTDLSFDCNEYAESAKAVVTFKLSSDAGEKCKFFVDGRECSSFDVNGDSKVRLGVVFEPGTPEGLHVIKLASTDRSVDRIANADIGGGEEWQAQFQGSYKVKANPLKVALTIIGLLLLGLLILWLTVLKYLVFPRFRVTMVYVGKDEKVMVPKRVRGYRKFVITSGNKRQGLFLDIFAGKVQYFKMSAEDGVTEDIVIEPVDKRTVRICRDKGGVYMAMPSRVRIMTIGQPSDVADVINQQLNKRVKVKIQ